MATAVFSPSFTSPSAVPGRYRTWYVSARLLIVVLSLSLSKKYVEVRSDIGAKVVQRDAFVRVAKENRARVNQRRGYSL